jgi:hypothetical protein
MHVRVSILLTIRGERIVRGPNVILSRQHLTPAWDERSEFSLFRSTATGGGNRSVFAVQLIANRSSPTSKMILSVDSIDSCGQLRKLDDALYRMGFAFIAPLPATAPFSFHEPPPCTGSGFLPLRILAIGSNGTTRRATGTIAFSSMESAPTLHFGLDSWRG